MAALERGAGRTGTVKGGGSGEHDAGNAVAALLARLPPERREQLRARVREGRMRLGERDLGGLDMSFDGKAEADLAGAPLAPRSTTSRSSGPGAHDWSVVERGLAALRVMGQSVPGAPPAPLPTGTERNVEEGNSPTRSRLRHVVRLSEIVPERLRWLSPGRLAAGKITVLDGDPGLGKSTLLCELAARVTRGEALPGGTGDRPRGVVLLSAEDDLQDTIRPRLDAAGGDPRRVISLMTVPDGTAMGRPVAFPGDALLLEVLVKDGDAALVIVDPLVAFLDGKLNANSDQDVRRALAALKSVAERTGAAIVAVRHLNKSTGTNPIYRGGGSIGIIGAARCGLLLAQDPDDPEQRILAVTKGNLARAPVSLTFRLEDVPGADVARVVWDGESRWTAAALLREADKGGEDEDATPSTLDEARGWLRQALAAGPRPAKAMQAEAAVRGISEISLRRARRSEGIVARKARGAQGVWTWSLPSESGKGDHASGLDPHDRLDRLDRLTSPMEEPAPGDDDDSSVHSPAVEDGDPWDRRCVECGELLLPNEHRLCASCAVPEVVAGG